MAELQARDLQDGLGSSWQVQDLQNCVEPGIIQQKLTGLQGNVVLLFDELDSTNTLAKQLKWNSLANQCIALVARRQTSGYGRLGRRWHFQPGSSLALTIVQPGVKLAYPGLLPLLSGCAVGAMFRKHLPDPKLLDLKWPNDVWIAGRKAAGVLVESALHGNQVDLFFGLGCNIGEIKFPMELQGLATSLACHASEKSCNLPTCLVDLLKEHTCYFSWHLQGRHDQIISDFKKYSSFVSGRSITWQDSGKNMTGTTCGLQPTGELMCQVDGGEISALNVSEISLVR